MRAVGIDPSTTSYTTAINACAATGDWKKALMLLVEMRKAFPSRPLLRHPLRDDASSRPLHVDAHPDRLEAGALSPGTRGVRSNAVADGDESLPMVHHGAANQIENPAGPGRRNVAENMRRTGGGMNNNMDMDVDMDMEIETEMEVEMEMEMERKPRLRRDKVHDSETGSIDRTGRKLEESARRQT